MREIIMYSLLQNLNTVNKEIIAVSLHALRELLEYARVLNTKDNSTTFPWLRDIFENKKYSSRIEKANLYIRVMMVPGSIAPHKEAFLKNYEKSSTKVSSHDIYDFLSKEFPYPSQNDYRNTCIKYFEEFNLKCQIIINRRITYSNDLQKYDLNFQRLKKISLICPGKFESFYHFLVLHTSLGGQNYRFLDKELGFKMICAFTLHWIDQTYPCKHPICSKNMIFYCKTAHRWSYSTDSRVYSYWDKYFTVITSDFDDWLWSEFRKINE